MRLLPRYLKKKTALVICVCLFYLSLSCFSEASAQVQIVPIALYLNDDNKTGRIVVRNSSNKPQELSIDLIFGYPDADEKGDVYLKKFDTAPEGAPSATEWIRIYPRHLVLPPREQQTIRFAARPPADLAPGEYWVRPAISSSDAAEESSKVTEDISASINLIKRTFLSLNYRHGKVQTGLAIDGISVNVSEDKIYLFADLDRRGNAAYLGHFIIRILDSSGEVLQQKSREIAVYRSQQRRFKADIGGLAAGNYRVELTFSTDARAEENDAILTAPPVSESANFVIK